MTATSHADAFQSARREAIRTATTRHRVELVFRDETGEEVIRSFPTLLEATEWSIEAGFLPEEVVAIEETVSRDGRVLFTVSEATSFDA